MQACDEDAEHTIGRTETSRPTMDHNMVYVAGEILKSCPVYAHFGLWSIGVSEHVTTRKTQRRIHAGGCRSGRGHHTGCARLAPTMQARQDSDG